MCVILCVITISISACDKQADNTMSEAERRDMIVSEYNMMTEMTREQIKQVKAVEECYGTQLMDLYLFNIADSTIKDLFLEYDTEKVPDDVNESSNLTSFYNIVLNGVPYDTYDKYLYDFAKRKGIKVSEIRTNVQAWSQLTESEQALTIGTEEDYGAFALYNATVAEHDFYTTIGTDNVTEVYLIIGENTQQLSVFVTWQNGKIVDVTRMYNVV